MTDKDYINDALELLKRLIATPSVSRDEAKAADIMEHCMREWGLQTTREGNNIWSTAPDYCSERPTLLLNAHIDTVKPVAGWQHNPFESTIEGDFIYGLGSNDCGGGLVTLLQVYRHLISRNQPYNLVYLASAEEEVSGINGIRRAIPLLPKVDVAIVGEPTGMQPAIAEKGLMVLDVTAKGRSGHAARGEGLNAIYEALDDLVWMRGYKFPKVSDFLGSTVMNVTVINAGTQHNVIPGECHMVVDVRTNEHYDNREVYDFLCSQLKSEVKARSFHLRSSHIPASHPIVRKCESMGMKPFGSPTLSDQALMPWPSLKLGPGMSQRSHSADEFILASEISQAFATYVALLDGTQIA